MNVEKYKNDSLIQGNMVFEDLEKTVQKALLEVKPNLELRPEGKGVYSIYGREGELNAIGQTYYCNLGVRVSMSVSFFSEHRTLPSFEVESISREGAWILVLKSDGERIPVNISSDPEEMYKPTYEAVKDFLQTH